MRRRGLVCFAVVDEVRPDLLDHGGALRGDFAFALGVGDGTQEVCDKSSPAIRILVRICPCTVGISTPRLLNALGTAYARRLDAVVRGGDLGLDPDSLAIEAIGAAEVARAALHTVRNHVDACQMSALLLRGDRVDAARDKQLADLSFHLGEIVTQVTAIRLSFRRSTAADDSSVGVRELAVEAGQMLEPRLAASMVTLRVEGPNSMARVNRADLRHVFLQLGMNSSDAFQQTRRTRNREIAIMIDAPPRSDDMVIAYRDNAAGVSADFLDAPDRIFEPGVTTKARNGGYGLYLVRRILERSGGAIRLTEFRDAVAFDIRLPRQRRPGDDRE